MGCFSSKEQIKHKHPSLSSVVAPSALAPTLAVQTSPPLQCVPFCDTRRFMGLWFVIACKPTYFEKSACNAVERYSLVNPPSLVGSHLIPLGGEIKIDFTYNYAEGVGEKIKSIEQDAWVASSNGEQWTVSPMWPLKLPYLILEVDEEKYEWCVVGVPIRSYFCEGTLVMVGQPAHRIMCRRPVMDKVLFDDLMARLEKKHNLKGTYDLKGMRIIPQTWNKEQLQEMGV